MKLNIYQKVAITTIIATIFLVFVGGLVRASGSGLGCPDWPKCFGNWVPPTTIADLPSQFDASQFNVYKTWTEYINRLVGVVIGLLITATFALSFFYRKTEPAVIYSSATAFILVLFQGWLGGQVVKTGLNEWLITIHMLLAMVIMSVLLYAVFKASSEILSVDVDPKKRQWLFWTGVMLLFFTLAQMILGTQVREAVDLIKNVIPTPPRELWLDRIGHIDELHRSFSWTVLLSGILLFYLAKWKTNTNLKLLSQLATSILSLIILQVILGIGLYYLGMPPSYQVLHLITVAVLVCFEFLFLLIVGAKRYSPDKKKSQKLSEKIL